MPQHRMTAERQLAFERLIPEAILLLVLATIAFDIRLSPIALQGTRVPILLFEFPLAILFLLTLVHLVRSQWRPTSMLGWVGVLLGALFVISALVHPSSFAALRLYRFAAASAFSYWIFTTIRSSERKHLYMVAAAVALFQAYLATGQHFLGKGMGYSFLGEADYLYGGSEGPRYVHGTFPLHHILAGFTMAMLGLLMQAKWPSGKARRWWFAVVAAATVPIGFAYSRMGAVAWLSIVGLLGLASARPPRRHMGLLVAILLGGLFSGIVGIEGWNLRATETIEGEVGGDDEGADVGGRISLAIQAARVVEQQPVFGTGIGRYLSAARQQQGEHVQLIAHNVPLLVAAENGILAGILVVLLLGVAGLAALRAGALALAVFSTYLAFILFDHFPYEDTQGIAMTGLWIGAVAAATKSAQET